MQPEPTIKFMRTMATVAAGTEAFCIVDTKGYDYGTFTYVTELATVASSQDLVALAHNDTLATAYTHADVETLSVGGTDFTIVAESTSFANIYQFNVDLRSKKRYIILSYESDGIHSGVGLAMLHKSEDQIPVTIATTADGVRNLVRL